MSATPQDIERLMDQARVKLTGASDAGIKGELFDVFNEYFGGSSSWLEDIRFNVVAGTLSYNLVPSDGGQIIRLAGIADADGLPQPALMPSFGTIILRNPPSKAQVFVATVAKNVDLPTDKKQFPIVPEWVLSVYGTSILDGLLGRMMMQQNKSYSNPTLGMYHTRKFNDAVQRQRVATMRQNAFGTQVWNYPQQYRTRSQRGGVSVGNVGRF